MRTGGGLLAGVVLVLVAHGCAALAINEGLAAYQRGDYATALRLWRPLAEQGDAVAQHDLAVMYYTGHGVKKDLAEAVKWSHKAAEQGFAIAQYNVGVAYEYGQSVPQDYVRAHMWYNLAASSWKEIFKKSLLDDSRRNRARVAAKMTPAQIAEAQRLAREWKPKNP